MTRKEYNKCVDDFADALFRFIVKSSHNKALADDIVQDSFLILWENVSEIACVKAKSFLFTTAYHKLIDTFRHEKKNADFENINPTSYLTEEKFTDLNEILEFALNKLPPIQKTVVLLRDYENYSYKEIAEITSLSETQVKVCDPQFFFCGHPDFDDVCLSFSRRVIAVLSCVCVRTFHFSHIRPPVKIINAHSGMEKAM